MSTGSFRFSFSCLWPFSLAFNKSLLSFIFEALSSVSVIFPAFSSSGLSQAGTDDSAPVLSTDSGLPGLQLGP